MLTDTVYPRLQVVYGGVDEFRGSQSLPVSPVFSISEGMDTIYMVYSLYWLAPYACGIQEVALPVSMLSENMALTERGRKLFSL